MAELVVSNLEKTFPAAAGSDSPTRALSGISFRVPERSFVSVVGPSGCGKSTLLNIVSGLEQPSGGSLDVVTGTAGRSARLGYVFQDARLLPWRTVLDNLMYVQDRSDEDTREEMLGFLELVGLRHTSDMFPGQLSGGMQQRVGIARAFSVRPDLLLMDEPFSHLDAISGRGLREELQQIWEKSKVTVLFVTHDVVEAVQLSDTIIVLAPGGHLHEEIPVDLSRPRHLTDPDVALMQANVLRRLEDMSITAPQTP